MHASLDTKHAVSVMGELSSVRSLLQLCWNLLLYSFVPAHEHLHNSSASVQHGKQSLYVMGHKV